MIGSGRMVYVYNNTVRGYNHIKSETVCQDYSDSYVDNSKQIITCCDGHGSKVYLRSNIGSKIASNVVIDVLKNYNYFDIVQIQKNKNYDKLKLEILCKWNSEVEKHLEENPLEEVDGLTDKEQFRLKNNPVTAYGTTLNSAMLIDDKIVCIQIGDGGLFLVKERKITNAFPENDENVANITNSLCSDDAYQDLFVDIYDADDYDGVFLLTDGVLAPYGTYQSLESNLINVIEEIVKSNTKDIIDEELNIFLKSLGEINGNGDDVSLSIIYYK
jgi:hypothetical protein